MSYVYLHEFPDGKYYVGHTERDPEERWRGGHGYDEQPKMADAICKYGWDNVKHLVIKAPDEESAIQIEAHLIRLLDTVDNGYNTIEEKANDTYYELTCYKAMYTALQKKYERCMGILNLLTKDGTDHNIL